LGKLIESAFRKFLYELSLAEIRRRIPQVELSAEEVERELEEIRRVKLDYGEGVDRSASG
jgi:hypothetical protein